MPIETVSTTDAAPTVEANKTAETTNKSASQGNAEATLNVDKTAEASDEIQSDESETSETNTEDIENKESDESSEDEKDKAKEDAEKPNRPGFKRRIQKLTKQNSEKDREIEFLRSQLNNVKPQEKPVVESTGDPDPDDFETHADYVKALVKNERDKQKRSDEQESLKKETQAKINTFNQRVDEFVAKHKDYHDLVADCADIAVGSAIQNVILESENGPELIYALAKDPEELERIASLPVALGLRELGKFEARLLGTKEEPSQKKLITKAPAPIEPVAPRATTTTKKTIFDEDIDQATYESMRRKQQKSA